MTYSLLVSTLTSMIINSWPNKKLLGYSFKEQIKDIIPGILLAIFMGIIVSFVNLLNLSPFLTLCIQVPFGALIYIMGSKILRLDSFEYLLQMSKSLLKK